MKGSRMSKHIDKSRGMVQLPDGSWVNPAHVVAIEARRFEMNEAAVLVSTVNGCNEIMCERGADPQALADEIADQIGGAV